MDAASIRAGQAQPEGRRHKTGSGQGRTHTHTHSSGGLDPAASHIVGEGRTQGRREHYFIIKNNKYILKNVPVKMT